jgi:adenosine deaminase
LDPIASVPPPRTGIAITQALRQFFKAIPKVELHCHLLGAVRKSTFEDLRNRNQAPIEQSRIDALYHRGDKPIGAIPVLRALESQLLTRLDDFHRITYEYLEDAAQDNIRHAEIFWNPTATLRSGRLSYRDIQAAIHTGMADGAKDFGISAGLIPAVDREASPAEAVELIHLMIEHRAAKTLGLGIDYREVDRPPELFAQAFQLAKKAGFFCTAHAGEYGMGWQNIASAIDLLSVDRLDHGYTVIDNPELTRRCAERSILFTVVPTNSYYLRELPPETWASDHPILRMAELGLKIHPNSDDPTLHHITQAGAFEVMHTHFGFSFAQLRQMMLDGIDGSWVDSSLKRDWRAHFAAEFDHLAHQDATA